MSENILAVVAARRLGRSSIQFAVNGELSLNGRRCWTKQREVIDVIPDPK
jgi:hypothetical protein